MHKFILLLIALSMLNHAEAAPRIAIVDFELNDITSLPNTPHEQQRTAAIKPLLEQALGHIGGYEMIQIPATDQLAANSSFGYLFRFHDLAAQLGQRYGADWVIVGQHSKPSFLYSYLLAHLIQVKHQSLTGNYAIEMKGNHAKVTQRSVLSLAHKIHALIGG